MKRIDRTVLVETGYVALWSAVLSVLLQAVFLLIKRWDITVLLGNLLGVFLSVLNFFLMGIAVQIALEKDEKEAKNTLKVSQVARFFLLFVGLVVGVLLPCFNTWTAVIPLLLFTRVAIFFRARLDKKQEKTKGGAAE